VLARLADGCEIVPADAAALATTPTEVVLQDEIARAHARKLFAQGRALSPLLHRVHAVVDDEYAEDRFAALALLLASPAHHARAIERAAALWERDPMNAMFGELAGACQGPGWGRRHLPKKLLPLTRVLWRRFRPVGLVRSWPLHFLYRLVAGDPAEAGWERVRECVGEHLLQLALDGASPEGVRRAALDAIAVLQPGGDGSIAIALSKVAGTGSEDLRTRAREVQREVARSHRTADGELAVDDAWEVFWRAVPEDVSVP
jgi:hypothetical protein